MHTEKKILTAAGFAAINNILGAVQMNIAYDKDDYSLYIGMGGKILMQAFLNKFEQYNFKIEEGVELLIDAIDREKAHYFPFCGGISGAMWLLHYLKAQKAIELDDDFFDDVNKDMVATASYYLKQRNYDFMHGAGGIMLCLLKQVQQNRLALEELTLLLLQARVNIKGYLVWLYTGFDKEVDYTYKISLGLSHGLPSLLVLLSKLYKAGIREEECLAAVNELYRFMESEKNTDITTEQFAFYPAMIKDSAANDYSSRLAWCYGDMGVASALYTTGKNTGNAEMQNKGLEIYEYYAAFNKYGTNGADGPSYGVKDSSFCHGAAGLVLLFKRMYHNSGNEKFLQSAAYWLSILLNMNYHPDGIDGYKYFAGEDGWKVNPSLLEGTTGVVLAIASYLSADNPDWDECFLIS